MFEDIVTKGVIKVHVGVIFKLENTKRGSRQKKLALTMEKGNISCSKTAFEIILLGFELRKIVFLD